MTMTDLVDTAARAGVCHPLLIVITGRCIRAIEGRILGQVRTLLDTRRFRRAHSTSSTIVESTVVRLRNGSLPSDVWTEGSRKL
jgi:hypothetical protein